MADFKNILIAVDFSELSSSTVRHVTALAPAFHSEVTILHVYERPDEGGLVRTASDAGDTREYAAAKELERFLDGVTTFVPNAKGCFRVGNAVEEILAVIDEIHPDLVVMGTHGRSGKRYLFLGSVAEQVVRRSPVPVLTVRQEAAAQR